MKETITTKVPVALIDENEWNGPREADEGLVASVRQDGLLQPVCVKPQGKRYVLAFGARRLDAARKTGLKEVPAVVLDAKTTPKAMRTLTLIENIQRVEQKPIQEGRVFKELIEAGMALSDIARRIGKTPSFVRRRLALTGLSPQAQEFVEENGSYSVEAVAMLAALNPARQMEIIERNPHYASDPELMRCAIRGCGVLDGSQFDPEDAALLPKVGPCTACKKRTGAEKLLFGEEDWENDTCLDEVCFAAKTSAHIGREIAKIRKKHPTAKCWVEEINYNYSTQDQKRMYDEHGAEVLKDWRIAYLEADKANPAAQVGILIESGTAREVLLIPAPRQKDGRANKPKTAEEKAAFLEKRRMAWIASKVRDKVIAQRPSAVLCDEGTAADLMRFFAEAISGTDLSVDQAAACIFEKIRSHYMDNLLVMTISDIDVEKLRDRALRVLRVFFAELNPEEYLAELEKEAKEEVR